MNEGSLLAGQIKSHFAFNQEFGDSTQLVLCSKTKLANQKKQLRKKIEEKIEMNNHCCGKPSEPQVKKKGDNNLKEGDKTILVESAQAEDKEDKREFTSIVVPENQLNSLHNYTFSCYSCVQYINIQMNSLKKANLIISDMKSLLVLIVENAACCDTKSLELSSLFCVVLSFLDLPSLHTFYCNDYAFHEVRELRLNCR